MKKVSCGIDFGTTNSVMGVARPTGVELISLEHNYKTIPTALFFSKTDVLFGRTAINTYVGGNEGRFMRSIKRILGTDLMDKYTVIGGKSVKFDDIISCFLHHIKKRSEDYIHQEISSVVLGRPVYYQDNDTAANIAAENKMRHIATMVGFDEIVFQYEPIAAAFAHEQKLSKDKLALVIDLGGGTSDFTIIQIGPSRQGRADRSSDILATGGIRIGGNDFDRCLSLTSFMPEFGRGTTYGHKRLPLPSFIYSDLSEWSKINFTYTAKNIQMINEVLLSAHDQKRVKRLLNLLEYQEAHTLLKTVEDMKIRLTSQESISTDFEQFYETIYFKATQKEFEKACVSEVDKITKSLNDTLIQAGIRANQVEMLILTGGTCEIPLVQRTIRTLFPDALISDTEKMDSVGLGLTHMAQKIFN